MHLINLLNIARQTKINCNFKLHIFLVDMEYDMSGTERV